MPGKEKMAEAVAELSPINLEGALGHEARYFGRDAFSLVVNGFSRRAEKDPGFAGNLRKLVDFAHTSKDNAVVDNFIQFGKTDRQHAKSLSEQLLGRWVALAAEKALPETQGARYLALDGEVERLEDGILLAHNGDKSVALDEGVLRILADPSGDISKRMADAVDKTVRTLTSAKARLAYKVATIETIGIFLFNNCTGGGGIIPTSRPDLSPSAPTVTLVAPTQEATPYNPAETQTPPVEATYKPPSIESVTFPPNSGGGVDRETIMSVHAIEETKFKEYEDAAILEANASGFSAGSVELNYIDHNELWNIYLRDKTTGNLLWSYRKSDNAMATQPVMWVIDATGTPQPNPEYELRPIEGSQDSRIVYTGDFLVEIAKPIVMRDGSTLYTQWRSIFTDTLAWDPAAAEALDITLVDGAPTIDPYDTPEVKGIVLPPESIKSIETTDALNPNILTAQDAAGNTYAFNPDHGWFALPDVQMNYADLPHYTPVTQAFMEDGRNEITRALNYANSSEKISPNAHPVMWVTAIGNINNLLCLSFYPVGRTGNAQILWPTEYADTFYTAADKPFVFSGFYEVTLHTGEIVYVIDRTIKIDDTHTSGLANGFDQATYERLAIEDAGPGRSPLVRAFEHATNGLGDFVTLLLPPDHLPDGTPIPFDPNTAALDKNYNPVVASLQADALALFSDEDQQRILDVVAANQHAPDGSVQRVTAPLTDPSVLNRLVNRILWTTIGTP